MPYYLSLPGASQASRVFHMVQNGAMLKESYDEATRKSSEFEGALESWAEMK